MSKKAFPLIALALLLMSSARVLAEEIIVKGKIEGIKSGKLLLVAQTSETRFDTLASAPFKSSKFTLKADIAEPIVAQLVVDTYSGGFTFIAEPGEKYEALLKNAAGAYIKGGKLQDEWQSYIKHSEERRVRLKDLQTRYEELRGQMKYRSASAVNDTLQRYNAEISEETDKFLAAHDDIITAHTFQLHTQQTDAPLPAVRALYEKMGEGARNSVSGRIMKERIDRMAKTEAGRPAPDFTLPDLQGNPVQLSKVPGKIKILDFWASWCGPCRLNNPHLKGLYEKYHAQGLEVISVSLDSKKEPWAKAVEKDGLPWINVSSLKGTACEVARDYSVTSIPAIFVLNSDNRIITTNLRGEALDNFLAEQFK